MNREKLEEIIEDCIYDNYGIFPTYDELVSYMNGPPEAELEIEIDRNMYDNICEDRYHVHVYGHGTINEGHWKSREDYIK